MNYKKVKLTLFLFLLISSYSFSQRIDIYYNGNVVKLSNTNAKLYQIDENKTKKLLKFDNNNLLVKDSINGVGLEFKNKSYQIPLFTDMNEQLSFLKVYIRETNIPLIYNFRNIAIEYNGTTFYINKKKILGFEKQVEFGYPDKIKIIKKQGSTNTYKIDGIKDFKKYYEKTSNDIRNQRWYDMLPEGGHKSFYLEIPDILCYAHCGSISESALSYGFCTLGCNDSLDIRIEITVNYTDKKNENTPSFIGEETRHDSVDIINNRHYYYGKLNGGTFWKTYNFNNFTISYYNVPASMKEVFDYSIDSFRFKRKK